MNSIADGLVHIQTSSEAQFATPSWLGEVALVASHLRKQEILTKICERVRFARRRFGRYDVLDFVAVLFGYAISGERTLEAFYEVVQPFASTFMALFGRSCLPAASTLSRFLAALPAEPVEALRTLFLEDLLARHLSAEEQSAGLPSHNEHPPTPPASGYAPPATATPWKAGHFTRTDFPLQPDGALRCPAGSTLLPHEHRREASGSLRVVYGASIRACRPCPLREQCQWNGSATDKPRQVSMLLHPLAVGSAPLLWRDWHRRHQRQACLRLHRSRLDIQMGADVPPTPTASPPIL